MAFLFATLFLVETSRHSSKAKQQQLFYVENDPNLEHRCRGALSEHSACLCTDSQKNGPVVACINAQFVDTGALMFVNGYYDDATSVTFHGNNFQELPDSALFGSRQHLQLRILNLSANYIVNLNSEALRGAPNIEVLDLSNNEIVLTQNNLNFLSNTPKLTHLYLRRAFASPTNRTIQFDLMMQMFQNAKLDRLKLLDLSYNFFHFLPYNLPCPFKSLTSLDLHQNLLKSIAINASCIKSLRSFDLSRNYFHELDSKFRTEFADNLLPQSLFIRNSFYCDCKSVEWIRWLKSTEKIADKSILACAKSSPPKFTGTRLIDVLTSDLDCRTNLFVSNAYRPSEIVNQLLSLALLLSGGVISFCYL